MKAGKPYTRCFFDCVRAFALCQDCLLFAAMAKCASMEVCAMARNACAGKDSKAEVAGDVSECTSNVYNVLFQVLK